MKRGTKDALWGGTLLAAVVALAAWHDAKRRATSASSLLATAATAEPVELARGEYH